MIPHSIRAITALGALALAQTTVAVDFSALGDIDSDQCNTMSSLYGEYLAPKRLVQAQTEIIKGQSRAELAAETQARHEWLTASQGVVKSATFAVELSPGELRDIGAGEDIGFDLLRAEPRRVQVGVDKPLGMDIDFADLEALPPGEQAHMGGVLSQGLDGEMVWTGVAFSRGAVGLRIGFEDVNLPAGAELYVYNDSGQAVGPYTGRGPNNDGTFWSNTVFGERVTLQLHHFGSQDADTLLNLAFRVSSLVHIGPRFPLAEFADPDRFGDKSYCSYNASCVESGNSSGNAPVSDAKKAVALMVYTSRGSAYICSGGLMADTDGNSVKNYFLTANHCISKGREANSLETFFGFDGACGDRYAAGSSPSTNGSSIKSTSKTGDYTLLELNQTPGGTRAYLGWNNAPVANTDGAQLYRISHPSGAPQAYSHHEVDTSKGTCGSWPRGNWIYSHDLFGATEGGSSGSPVLNSAGQVVGQLSGGCGTNVSDTCDTVSNATVDGALAGYFGSVEQFLDPGGQPPPPPPPGGDEVVDSVTISTTSQGPWNRAVATIRIVDGSGNPVANAVVSGSFGGDASGSGSGTTDNNGVTSIRSNRTRNDINNPSFCVDAVNGSTATGNTCS